MRFTTACIYLLLFCTTLQAVAQNVTRKVKVEAGASPRVQTPVTFKVELSPDEIKALGPGATATLNSADTRLAAQIEWQKDKGAVLYFIEPKIDAGQSKSYTLVFEPERPAVAKPSGFHFEPDAGFVDLMFDKTPVLRQMVKYDPADRANTFKPFHHVYGFHDDGFITKGPGGTFTHHRGLFFGFKLMSGKTLVGDFWHCPKEYQKHREFIPERELAGPIVAREASITDWMLPDNKPVAADTREVTTWRLADGRILMDWNITVESLGGDYTLTGDPQHAGFHFRAAQEVAERGKKDKGTQSGDATYVLPKGAVDKKGDVWADCPFACVKFSIKNNPYTVVHIDGPGNPKPTVYSTRAYARTGAFFNNQDLKPGTAVKLSYRIVVMDGAKYEITKPEDVAGMVADFVSPVTVAVEK